MPRHLKAALPTLAITLTLANGCSDYGEVLDPYADMDQGVVDMMEVTEPDIPEDKMRDEAPDTPDADGPELPVMMELPAPKELQAVAEPTGITLTWLPARGALRYEVRINGGPWKSTGTEMQFVHEDAPGGSVTSATIAASDMTERPHVALEATDIVGEPGPEQTYEVRAVHEDGASMPSAPATAQRPFEVATITWERQDEGAPDWLAIPDATGAPTIDATATPEGDIHTYRALITPTAGETYTSDTDAGARLAAVQVSVGSRHACARLNNGEVKCWGENSHGQLGLGHKDSILQDPSSYPLKSALLGEPVKSLSAGSVSTCAENTLNLYCWGEDHEGQDYEFSDNAGAKSVTAHVLEEGIHQFPENFGEHMCYITSNQRVKCFGKGSAGRLGYGTTEGKRFPGAEYVELGASSANFIEVGGVNSCAIMSDGGMKCWGAMLTSNAETLILGDEPGEMPPNNFELISDNAAQLLALHPFISNTCVLLEGSTPACWGKGALGILGNGSEMDVLPPGSVNSYLLPPFVRPISELLMGWSNVCIISSQNDLFCWGAGESGVNGNGSRENVGDDPADSQLSPVNLGGPIQDVSVGHFAACSVVLGEVACWGDNQFGQLGRLDTATTEVVGDEPGEMPPQPVQLW